MNSSSIYNRISRPSRHKTSADFGAGDGFEQTVLVGTSAKNSHTLGVIEVQRIAQADGRVEFALYLDNTMLRRGILDGKEFTREDITEL